jgi:hypothetical protein
MDCDLGGDHTHRLLVVGSFEAELDLAVHLCIQRMVLADADVVSGVDARTTWRMMMLPRLRLRAIGLHAETFCLGIPSIS